MFEDLQISASTEDLGIFESGSRDVMKGLARARAIGAGVAQMASNAALLMVPGAPAAAGTEMLKRGVGGGARAGEAQGVVDTAIEAAVKPVAGIGTERREILTGDKLFDAAERIASSYRLSSEVSYPEEVRLFNEAFAKGDAQGVINAMSRSPLSVFGHLATETVFRNPIAAGLNWIPIAGSVGTFEGEKKSALSNYLIEGMQELGLDPSNVDDVVVALGDQELVKKSMLRASERAQAVAATELAVDVASIGLARFMPPPLKKAMIQFGLNMAMQTAGEGVGELAGQAAGGEPTNYLEAFVEVAASLAQSTITSSVMLPSQLKKIDEDLNKGPEEERPAYSGPALSGIMLDVPKGFRGDRVRPDTDVLPQERGNAARTEDRSVGGWYTRDPSAALTYAQESSESSGDPDKAEVLVTRIRLENAADLDDLDAAAREVMPPEQHDVIDRAFRSQTPWQLIESLHNDSAKQIRARLREKGHDGLFLPHGYDTDMLGGDMETMLVFDSKSVELKNRVPAGKFLLNYAEALDEGLIRYTDKQLSNEFSFRSLDGEGLEIHDLVGQSNLYSNNQRVVNGAQDVFRFGGDKVDIFYVSPVDKKGLPYVDLGVAISRDARQAQERVMAVRDYFKAQGYYGTLRISAPTLLDPEYASPTYTLGSTSERVASTVPKKPVVIAHRKTGSDEPSAVIYVPEKEDIPDRLLGPGSRTSGTDGILAGRNAENIPELKEALEEANRRGLPLFVYDHWAGGDREFIAVKTSRFDKLREELYGSDELETVTGGLRGPIQKMGFAISGLDPKQQKGKVKKSVILDEEKLKVPENKSLNDWLTEAALSLSTDPDHLAAKRPTQAEVAETQARFQTPPSDVRNIKPQDQPTFTRRVASLIATEMSFDSMPASERIAWSRVFVEAAQGGHVEFASSYAENQFDDPSIGMDGVKSAAVMLKRAQHEERFEQLTLQAEQALSEGRRQQAVNLQNEAFTESRWIELYTGALKASASAHGRALNFVKTNEPDVFNLHSMLVHAQVDRGRTLTKEEQKGISAIFQKLRAAQSENKEIEASVQRSRTLILENLAQRAINERSKQEQAAFAVAAKDIASREKRRQEIVARIDVLKKEFEALGFRTTAVMGVDPQVATVISKLAVEYIKLGVTDFNTLMLRIMGKVPDLTKEQILAALVTLDPTDQSLQIKELSAIKQEFRGAAAVLSSLSKLMNDPLTASKALAQLEQKITARLIPDAERLQKIRKEIAKLQQKISSKQFDPSKPRVTNDPLEVAEAKMTLNDLRSLLRAEREINRIEKILSDPNNLEIYRVEQAARSIERQSWKLRNTPEAKALRGSKARLTQARNELLRAVFASSRPTGWKVATESMNLLRQLKATADISTVMRQGLISGLAAPDVGAKAAVHATKAFDPKNGERYAAALDATIKSDPSFIMAVEDGLYFAPYGDSTKLTTHEEYFSSYFIRQLPDFESLALESGGKKALKAAPAVLHEASKAAERAMISNLNFLRFEIYKQYMEANPGTLQKERQEVARLLNMSTGRGNFKPGTLGRVAPLILFAPRFALTRAALPFYLTGKALTSKHAGVRKLAAKHLAGNVVWGMTVLGLASLAGLEVGDDPDDSDFGKIVWGNTRIDIWAGQQQFISALVRSARLAARKAGVEGLEDITTRGDASDPLKRFLLYKTSPAVGLLNLAITGKDIVGQTKTGKEVAVESVTPLWIQDAVDALIADGIGKVAITIPLTFYGLGASTYGNAMQSGPIKNVIQHIPYRPQPPEWSSSIKADAKLKETLDGIFEERMAADIWLNRAILKELGSEDGKVFLQELAKEIRANLRDYVTADDETVPTELLDILQEETDIIKEAAELPQ